MQLDFSTADQSAGSFTPRPSNHHCVSPAPWTVTDAAEAPASGIERPSPAAPSVMRGAAMGRRILVADLSAIRDLLGWGGLRRLPRGRVGFLRRDRMRYP